ncbi:MAG: 5-bromo-4-chloroindolyl phosphate hydrolysis family protein [Sulfitobacter sp.]|nr:5-bromo-4-chloroindolyl phosphate hydrolysis family protein [Sulfitobacter sp.]
MAQRFGGKYSPTGSPEGANRPRPRAEVNPVGMRHSLMFIPPVLLLATTLGDGALALTAGLAGAGALALGAWLLREGVEAEAAFRARKVARAPAIPRKIFAAVLTGLGAGAGVFAHQGAAGDLLAPILFGLCSGALHVAAFGTDPMRAKGMEGVDTFQQDRVARVVEEAEKHLAAMSEAIARAGDRRAAERLAAFQATARDLIRTVEEDPRDLTAARKYLGVYLRGARDATVKFADLYRRNGDAQARTDYIALLDDLDQNFAARTEKLLLDDRSDLTVEIEVLRERLSREGVRLD